MNISKRVNVKIAQNNANCLPCKISTSTPCTSRGRDIKGLESGCISCDVYVKGDVCLQQHRSIGVLGYSAG
ncbi:unnamed protein product [Clavelina lepadiformis]|uniref:Uncharacterized protein n=1 Tax=Clavelina lepadiformis TaxID=159417 RepID=A0ABP0GDM6_CLALP